ncbi:MAG: sn-glycerol-3-phosphate ABC transporter ATP-binding protein UgpC [Rhodococcus sp.]|nr:sn-glycerol-3-phosphate ABC transporter ATP-binding protein UgpC [Rhodococcus sp. (in: high G+C Gram-positive bacteria)]
MANVQFAGVTHRYEGTDRPAVDRLDLDIADGEFLVLVGPSGCGKSTSLRMLAGLESASDGRIEIGGTDVTHLAPRARDVAMVFQSYALYPNMTVEQNMGFALQNAGVGKTERRERVLEAARMLELEPLLGRKPAKLSGGQRQRVAMGRAIVRHPKVFCMDEPLSNLDAKLRVSTRSQIAALQRRLGTTTVYVTHDQVEAMTMGDRVAVLKDGVLQQVDTPTDLYDSPVNVFVAAFIGSPSMNLYEARFEGDHLTFGSRWLTLPDSLFEKRPALREHEGEDLIVGFRPEDLEDVQFASDSDPGHRLEAEVALVEALGAELIVHFELDAVRVDAGDPDAVDEIGQNTVGIGRFNPRSTARAGQHIEIAVDVENLHFFDAETRDSIWY